MLRVLLHNIAPVTVDVTFNYVSSARGNCSSSSGYFTRSQNGPDVATIAAQVTVEERAALRLA